VQTSIEDHYKRLKAAVESVPDLMVTESELPQGLNHAVIWRKGWMFVGTINPIGHFGSSELRLNDHNTQDKEHVLLVTWLATNKGLP
jgi:hypothetical protein